MSAKTRTLKRMAKLYAIVAAIYGFVALLIMVDPIVFGIVFGIFMFIIINWVVYNGIYAEEKYRD